MKKVLLLPLLFLLAFCSKKDSNKAPIAYTVTIKITGSGAYHYQKGGISATGHVNNSQTFSLGAQTNDMVEVDAIHDTLNKSITIETTCSPPISGGNCTKSGTGQQQINFQIK